MSPSNALPMAPYGPARPGPSASWNWRDGAVKLIGITASSELPDDTQADVLEGPADPGLAGYLAPTLTVEG